MTLFELIAQARAKYNFPSLPCSCPPCSDNDPQWLRDIHEQYVNTGFVEMGKIKDGLAVGETLFTPNGSYTRTAVDTVAIGDLAYDEHRAFRIERPKDES